MLTLPAELTRLYETLLRQQGVAREYRPHYAKWLRYYWDFCHKYGFEPWERQPVGCGEPRKPHPYIRGASARPNPNYI